MPVENAGAVPEFLVTSVTTIVPSDAVLERLHRLRDMADGSDQLGGSELAPRGSSVTVVQPKSQVVPNGLVAGIRSFAAGHGGATAVIEYVGKRGARIVLVGEDGSW